MAATGRFTDSHEALLESVALAADGPVGLRLKVTTACAAVEHLLGRHESAHARLLSALDGLPEGSPEAAALMIELAVDGLYRAEYDSMREWAERARDAASPVEDGPLTAAAVAALALAGAFAGRFPEADLHRAEAAALVDALPDAELALRLDAAANLAAAELYLDRYEEAVGHAERALRIGRATGQSDIVPVLFPTLGSAARMRGRLAESGELLDRAVEAARLSGHAQGLAWNLLNRSHTALQAGDVELALEAACESTEIDLPVGKTLITQGEPGRQCFVLIEGSVEVVKDGKKFPPRGNSEIFGEIALLSGGPCTATVTTTTPARALVISPRAFQALLDTSPSIQRRVLHTMSARLAPHLI